MVERHLLQTFMAGGDSMIEKADPTVDVLCSAIGAVDVQ